jgi:Flp pilus assembly protein TadG
MTTATATATKRNWRRNRCAAFFACKDGATAVEFALVAAPFLALLVGTIETFLVFFAGQQLETIVNQSSRQILTGAAQKVNMTQSAFAQQVCAKVTVLFNCSNLMIDVQTYSSFSATNTGTPTLTFNSQGQVTNTWQYQPGTAGQIVVVRVMYQWPVFLGPLGFTLSNQSNGTRLLMASAAFKNEPYQ